MFGKKKKKRKKVQCCHYSGKDSSNNAGPTLRPSSVELIFQFSCAYAQFCSWWNYQKLTHMNMGPSGGQTVCCLRAVMIFLQKHQKNNDKCPSTFPKPTVMCLNCFFKSNKNRNAANHPNGEAGTSKCLASFLRNLHHSEQEDQFGIVSDDVAFRWSAQSGYAQYQSVFCTFQDVTVESL